MGVSCLFWTHCAHIHTYTQLCRCRMPPAPASMCRWATDARFSAYQCLRVASGTAAALQYLHSMHISHGDVSKGAGDKDWLGQRGGVGHTRMWSQPPESTGTHKWYHVHPVGQPDTSTVALALTRDEGLVSMGLTPFSATKPPVIGTHIRCTGC